MTEHAGRRDGLSLVRQVATRAGARLRVMTQPQVYTHFMLPFGMPHEQTTLMMVDDSMVFRNRIPAWQPRGPAGPVGGGAGRQRDGGDRPARRHRPDAITMDLTMPLMDGPECLAGLRELVPQSRVLVVSALSDRSTALKAMMNGAHGFLLKPFSDQQLIESLQELLA